jgi:FMN-dependent oxidoreductase (nitrilotriacetate monooxygenase family)
MSERRQMHLLAFPSALGAHVAGWRKASLMGGQHSLKYYTHLARVAEAGLFDAIFFADAQGYRTIVGRDAYARVDAMRIDPLVLLGALAATTEKLGLICTLSTSYNEPYAVARRMATLDHLSEGRAGWNVVTSTSQNEARNFGRDQHFGHAERYARAGEFLDVVTGLWDSFEEGAVEVDQGGGRYFDPDKVHALEHQGEFFRVAGPLTCARPPQGHPVIVQAGSSDAGQALAARTAEVVFTSHPNIPSAQRFYAALKEQVVAAGRSADACKIMPAIQPLVADTQEQAQALEAELESLVHPDLAIAMLQMQIGQTLDLSKLDHDGPLPEMPDSNAARSIQARVREMSRDGEVSILQLARRIAAGRTSAALTGTPMQVADAMEEWFEAGAADGFVIVPPVLPDQLEVFVAKVVPELQRRGLFRQAYQGSTLREHLGLARPVSRYADPATPRAEPRIWQPDLK